MSLIAGGQLRDNGWEQPQVSSGNSLNKVIAWSFYALLFSLAFEDADLGLPLKLPLIIGFLFAGSTLLQPRLCFARPPFAFWLFFGHLMLCLAWLGFWDEGYQGAAAYKCFQLGYLLVLFWCSYNVLRDSQIARRALFALAAGCVLLAFMQLTGIAGASRVHSGVERLSAFGFHPNHLARLLSFGFVAIAGLAIDWKTATIRRPLVVLPLMAMLIVAVVSTGSRGGLLALAAALVTLLLSPGELRAKARMAAVAVALFLVLVGAAFASGGMRARIEKAVEQGSMTRRELIYPVAWQMFLERPLTGWGTLNNIYEIGGRLQHPDEESKDTHNLFLYVATATGFPGLLLFFWGLGLCLVSACRARGTPYGMLPFALFTCLMVATLSATWIQTKLFWIVLAYTLASAASFAVRSGHCDERKLDAGVDDYYGVPQRRPALERAVHRSTGALPPEGGGRSGLDSLPRRP
jgi:O-antigen ligase